MGHVGHLGDKGAEGGGGHLDDKGADGGGRVGAVGHDDVYVGHLGGRGAEGGGGYLGDKGADGGGGEGDGGRVRAVGLMSAELECNNDMLRSIGTGRQRSGLSRTTTRTGSTPHHLGVGPVEVRHRD